MTQNLAISINVQRVSFITKLYIWSIVLEPMLYFKFYERGVLPIHLTASRFFQMMVLYMLFLRVFFNPRFMLLHRIKDNVKLFQSYLCLIIFSSVIGFFSGSYVWQGVYVQSEGSVLYELIYNPEVRSIMELVIIIYQIGYFIFLCPLMIKNKASVHYFFKVLMFLGVTHFVLGFLDLFDLLPFGKIGRHFSDGRYVGFRFHGIAGEPRDAVVFGVFFYALLFLRGIYYEKSGKHLVWLFVIALSFICASSFSGVIGLGIGLVLHMFYLKKRYLLVYFVLALLTIMTLLFVDSRSTTYLENFYKLFTKNDIFNASVDSYPLMLRGQFNDIYILIRLYYDFINLNWLQLLIGHGIGSSQYVISKVTHTLFLTHAQLPRELFETGLLGALLFFIIAKKIYKNSMHVFFERIPTIHVVTFFLLFGAILGHRSYCLYIYLGVLLAVSQVVLNEKNTKNKVEHLV